VRRRITRLSALTTVAQPASHATAHQLLIETPAPQLRTEPTAVTRLALRQTAPSELISVAKPPRRMTEPQPLAELILASRPPSRETVLQRTVRLTVPQGQELTPVLQPPTR
jgi:hypothetical protein